jgi:regulator of sigma E protease
MGIIIAVLLFSFIIIFHELGHFLLAKKNGIRVDEFSLGLGPTLLGKQIGETKFSLKLLPFGGACMMGEDDADDLSEGSFNSKSVWARMSVVAAGPIFNLILACVLFYIDYDNRLQKSGNNRSAGRLFRAGRGTSSRRRYHRDQRAERAYMG